MAQDPANLIWIDMEMSGLNPDSDSILEIAIIVTDSQLKVIAEAPVFVVHQADEVLNRMDSWNTATHAKSGLVERVKTSILTESEVEERMVEFLALHLPPWRTPDR